MPGWIPSALHRLQGWSRVLVDICSLKVVEASVLLPVMFQSPTITYR